MARPIGRPLKGGRIRIPDAERNAQSAAATGADAYIGAYKEGNRRFEPQPNDSIAYRGDDLAAFCQFCQMTAPLFFTAAPI